MTNDSENYTEKKRFFNSLLTVFGRLTVLEALRMESVEPFRLHLSTSNKPAPVLQEIETLAKSKDAEIVYHDKRALSRISKNAKQDQGVALDLRPAGFSELDSHTFSTNTAPETINEFIALDRITNPQNLGMIIRSVCASPVRGLIIPRQGCAKLDALVIKASAGTLFKAPIVRCDDLQAALKNAAQNGAQIVGLDLNADATLNTLEPSKRARIFILGNESEGISRQTQSACTHKVKIAMHNNVESLNVAITAALIALRHQL